MTKIERVQSVIRGDAPDRPPFGFWHHFGADQLAGRSAVDAHLKHLEAYDLDFLKVFFDSGYPHDNTIESLADLRTLPVLDGDEGVFGEHLDTIRSLSAELKGRVLITTTIFNAWATLRRLLRKGPYVAGSGPSLPDAPASVRMSEWVCEDRATMAGAISVIGMALSNFATRCIEAGADGVFLSVRDDWVDTSAMGVGSYDELVRASDLGILSVAGEGRLNILHVCGQARNFDAFAEYPVHVLNWADRSAGPAIADVAPSLKPAPCGGIDQTTTLPGGSAEACADEVREAVAQAAGRPIIIAPGCTYDPIRVPRANLAAIRSAVEAV